jgi:hypothetical protein
VINLNATSCRTYDYSSRLVHAVSPGGLIISRACITVHSLIREWLLSWSAARVSSIRRIPSTCGPLASSYLYELVGWSILYSPNNWREDSPRTECCSSPVVGILKCCLKDSAVVNDRSYDGAELQVRPIAYLWWNQTPLPFPAWNSRHTVCSRSSRTEVSFSRIWRF